MKSKSSSIWVVNIILPIMFLSKCYSNSYKEDDTEVIETRWYNSETNLEDTQPKSSRKAKPKQSRGVSIKHVCTKQPSLKSVCLNKSIPERE